MVGLEFQGSKKDFDFQSLGRTALKSHELTLKMNEKIGYPGVIVKKKINRQHISTWVIKILEFEEKKTL